MLKMKGLNPHFLVVLVLGRTKHIALLVLIFLPIDLIPYSSMFDYYSWCWSTVHSMLWLDICVDPLMV